MTHQRGLETYIIFGIGLEREYGFRVHLSFYSLFHYFFILVLKFTYLLFELDLPAQIKLASWLNILFDGFQERQKYYFKPVVYSLSAHFLFIVGVGGMNVLTLKHKAIKVSAACGDGDGVLDTGLFPLFDFDCFVINN